MDAAFLDVLIFDVAGRRHGVPAADVQELLPALALVPLPDAAAGVEGVFNLRGVIVPVLSARHRFSAPARAVALSDHFIVIRHGGRLTALHVDQALEVARFDGAAISAVAADGSPARVATVGDGLALLHSAGDLVAAAADPGGAP